MIPFQFGGPVESMAWVKLHISSTVLHDFFKSRGFRNVFAAFDRAHLDEVTNAFLQLSQALECL